MPIELMRKIDYWLGIPICFLLSFIDKFLKLLIKRQEAQEEIKKVLFIKLSEIGSIILSSPLMVKVQKEYKGCQLFFLTFDKNKEILNVLKNIHPENILTIRDTSFYFCIKDVFKVIHFIRTKKIDVVFDLEFFSRFTAILSYLSGAIKRIGFYKYSFEGLNRGDLFTHKIQYNPQLHISKLFLSLWQVLNIPQKDTPEMKLIDEDICLPKIQASKEQKEDLIIRIKNLGVNHTSKIIFINPGEGTVPLREWPLNYFRSLIEKLLKKSENIVFIVGTEGSFKKVNKICNKNNRCIDFTGKTTISELLTLFEIGHILISNDSGLAHLASLTDIKQYVFFGPESPNVFAPIGKNIHVFYLGLRCSPCFSILNHRKSDCVNNLCLKGITPDKVFDKIKLCLINNK